MEHKMTDIKQIEKFVFGGNAVFTVRSLSSGEHFTFHIKKKKDENFYFVSKLNYNQDFSYMGYIGKRRAYKTTAKSQFSPDHVSHLVIRYLLAMIAAGRLHPKFEFFHVGRCGACGRPLTDPASIERGLGPTCASR